MSGISILIDTNIALYLLNGDEKIASILDGKTIYISEITELELLGYPGISKTEIPIIENLIEDCVIVQLNDKIKEMTIELRRNNKIKLPDAIIGATAKYLKLPILTADKGFGNISSLTVLQYEK